MLSQLKIQNDVFSKVFRYYDKDVEQLYKEESACLVIFRILPELCQQIIMRIILVDNKTSIRVQDLRNEWDDIMQHSEELKKCVFILFSIKIINDNSIIVLNEDFKKNMLKIMKSGLTPQQNLVKKKKNKDWGECFKNGINSLEKYLLNILELDGDYSEKSTEKIQLLIDMNLIHKEVQNYYKLTQIALQAMLENRQLQIRTLMIKYINFLGEKHRDRKKFLNFLNFLLNLSTLEVGAPYSLEYYDEEYRKHFDFFFRLLGIVHLKRRKQTTTHLYVTPLMKCLFEDINHMFENQPTYKFLIVESNFKVYAYTDSPLEKKIIDFLFEVEYIFPGLIIAHITRSSIRRVMKRGVTHQKILQYMSMHAHSQCEYKSVINKISYNVPENVAQQIFIWEEEKNAVQSDNVIYLFEFGENDYDRYLEKLKRERVPILWQSREKSILVIQKNPRNNLIIQGLN